MPPPVLGARQPLASCQQLLNQAGQEVSPRAVLLKPGRCCRSAWLFEIKGGWSWCQPQQAWIKWLIRTCKARCSSQG